MAVKKLNIFISIAPSHNRNFEDILRLCNSIESTNILINPGNYIHTSAVWDNVIIDTTKMNNPTGSLLNNIWFQIKKIKAYKKIIKEAEKRIPEQNFSLYYCNLEDILNNYFFFSFRKKLLNESILVEDGILNYYNYNLNKKTKKIFRIKQLISFFFGISYKMVSGQLSGIDMFRVKKQYVKYPLKAIFPEKAIALPIMELKYKPLHNRVLFIGQDILENILGTEKYVFYFKEIIGRIKEIMDEDFQLLYKPHRNGSYTTVLSLLDSAFGNQYELVLNNTPVEELIDEIKPNYIFSFYSTALLNIKMALPESSTVEIFFKPLETTDAKISQLFIESGINIIE